MATERKKSKKINRKSKYNQHFSFRIKNTIMSTIMLSMLIFVCIVIFVPAFNAINQVKGAEQSLPIKYLQYTHTFKELKEVTNKIVEKPDVGNKVLSLFLQRIPFDDLNVLGIYIINPYKNSGEGELIAHSVVDDKGEEVAMNIKSLKLIADGQVINFQYKNGTFDKTREQKISDREKTSTKESIKVLRLTNNKPDTETIDYYTFLVIKINYKDSYDISDKIVEFDKWFFVIALLISLIFIFLFARSISKPLVDMEKTVSKIADGDLSGRLEYTKYDEINQLVQSYNTMANALQRLYSTLEKQVQDRTQELKSAYAELQSTQAMMVHSEKMKSLGELVAGIMHEINNPINFIYGNMTHLNNYSSDLINIIEEYTKYNDSLKPEEKENVENLKQEFDYEFLKSDLPDLIKSCKEGADRAKNIIQDLKSFSRMEEVAITDVDIAKEIDTVLNILHNKIKHKAEVHKDYIEDIPSIEAFGGQLNQVFMNVLDNAVGAIQEHGDIWIRIKKDKPEKNLVIEVEDNGIGMDADTMDKVFNPFFTTKPVGQGTGLGMSITYKIIKNHQGDIRVESTPNVGTKFIITLPLNINRELLKADIENGEENG